MEFAWGVVGDWDILRNFVGESANQAAFVVRLIIFML